MFRTNYTMGKEYTINKSAQQLSMKANLNTNPTNVCPKLFARAHSGFHSVKTAPSNSVKQLGEREREGERERCHTRQ